MLSFMNSSGGLGYHLRSLRYKQTLWPSFRAQVKNWLNMWAPQGGSALLLIGPSAGYTLPAEWLQLFKIIYVLEPDPVARYLFKNYNAAANIKFLHEDALTENAADLSNITKSYLAPGDYVLFSNVLGQMHLINGRNHNPTALNSELNKLHTTYKVGSYHDRLSVAFPPQNDAVKSPLQQQFTVRLTNEELARTFFANTQKLEFQDHGTHELFTEGQPSAINYAPWALAPGRIHLIEWLAYS